MTCSPRLNGGHAVGAPWAAKLAHAARMLAASDCWSAVNVPGYGVLGWSKRYWSSDEWVAAGNGATRPGALTSSNSYANVGTRLAVQPSTCSAGQAKFASDTRLSKATSADG